MSRVKVFRRVLLSSQHEDGWLPAEREDGTRYYSKFSAGTGEAILVERRDDFAHELMASMARQN